MNRLLEIEQKLAQLEEKKKQLLKAKAECIDLSAYTDMEPLEKLVAKYKSSEPSRGTSYVMAVRADGLPLELVYRLKQLANKYGVSNYLLDVFNFEWKARVHFTDEEKLLLKRYGLTWEVRKPFPSELR